MKPNGRGPDFPRRAFIVGSVAAAGGGLALGLRLPFGRNAGIGLAEAKTAATALLAKTPKPTNAQIDTAMTNICRCGTYQRIRTAIHAAAASVKVGRSP